MKPEVYERHHNLLCAVVKEVRQRLGDANISHLNLRITAKGRTETGDVLLTYELCDYAFGEDAVRGGDLQAVVDEFINRRTWSMAHRTVALPYYDKGD